MNEIRILFVDDNCADRHLVREALKRNSHSTELDIAKDGVEAMNSLQKRGPYSKQPTPNLIILDLNLPRKSGREVLDELKSDADLKQIPVFIYSSSDSPKERLELSARGADFYVVKPFDLAGLRFVVKAIEDFGIRLLAAPESRDKLSKEFRALVK